MELPLGRLPYGTLSFISLFHLRLCPPSPLLLVSFTAFLIPPACEKVSAVPGHVRETVKSVEVRGRGRLSAAASLTC